MIPRGYAPSTMIDLMAYILPAAYRLLPEQMRSARASAMVMTCGLQESKLMHRRQLPRRPGGQPGPARSLWQFEPNGLRGVIKHPASREHVANVLRNLRYNVKMMENVLHFHEVIEHNDILACAMARLLLWTDTRPIPDRGEAKTAWAMYLRTWNPGDPKPDTWASYYDEAWDRVDFLPEAR